MSRGLIERRLDGIGDAREALGAAKRRLQEDGVGPNGRDAWTPERVAKWHRWIKTLETMDAEMRDEAVDVDEGR